MSQPTTPPDVTRAEELIDLLKKQKRLLIAVATCGPRVQDKCDEYATRRTKIREQLCEVGIKDPIPFANLWQWYQQWTDGTLPTYQSRRDFISEIIDPALKALSPGKDGDEATGSGLVEVFISHSAKDRQLAGQLAGLLRSALNLLPDQIRCTSVDGYRLKVGADADECLREETRTARAVVALLTPNSLNSPFVLFELGARWGAGRFLAPVAAGGLSPGDLKAPLSGMNVLELASRAQVFQLIQDIAGELQREVVSVAAFDTDLAALTEMAGRT